MKKQDNSPLAEASAKFKIEAARLQLDLPMIEVILQTKAEVEALSAQAGLQITRASSQFLCGSRKGLV